MIDLFNIPNSQQDIQIFYANGSSIQSWQKPRKCNYVWVMCIGGAGGGGGGRTVNASVPSTGGGSGAVSRALYNAQQLPDTLYVQVGVGGAGGASGIAGSFGTRSRVGLLTSLTTVNSLINISGQADASGGPVGTGANAPGETVTSQAAAGFLTLSNFVGTAGITSIGSNVLLNIPDINPLSSQITCPGGAGSAFITGTSTSYNGTSILSTSISPLISGGTLGTLSNAGNGADGITSYKPLYSLGGAGGGSTYTGIGGNGGNGGIGSGGGGGGSGPSGGGNGGKGGDGIVIIISF